MKESEELGDFKECTKQAFQEISSDIQVMNLYIHKTGYPNISVRAPKATKKIHCWRLKTLQVTQYAEATGARDKAVASIEFDGQLIFTHVDLFNQMMGRQILEYVENITAELRAWCAAPVKNIFVVLERMEESLGFRHGFIKVMPQLFYIDRSFYFQYRCWKGDVESDVPEIEIGEEVQGTSNYSGMFEYVNQHIKRYKMLKKMAVERKKLKQQQEKEQRTKKKMVRILEYPEPSHDNQMEQYQKNESVQFDQ